MNILTINDKNIQLIGRDCWTGYEYEPNTSYLQGIDSRLKKKDMNWVNEWEKICQVNTSYKNDGLKKNNGLNLLLSNTKY